MGLLGDMAKAAAKVAINQVSNTAHEKVSEMFPTKEIVYPAHTNAMSTPTTVGH